MKALTHRRGTNGYSAAEEFIQKADTNAAIAEKTEN